VVYFKRGKPTKGVNSHSTAYKKATYQFATAENKTFFLKDPE
jgi:YHS domain-containing protein